MKNLFLALSAAFLVGVSGLPWNEEKSKGALLLIPQDKIFLPLPLSIIRYSRTPVADVMPTIEDDDHTEENVNEHPVERDPPTHLVGSSGRSRRSTQPGAPTPGGQQQGQQSGDRGGVEVGVSRGEGGSRRVDARGEGNVWQSNDGRGRVDVHGHYSRDYGGRYGTGRPQYGGGIRYSHRF